ncbi:MAG: xylose isomerase [Luteolibacter sp.]|uniref:sugar phosphate isomerase/epimerase family protein n=1 Tax=Luteolibacter sp. TaxID=1962973 RepID=UPI0032679038
MPRELRTFAGLWTLRDYPNPINDWSLEKKFAAVKEAGFDGIGGLLIPETIPLCGKYGLEYILYLNADASTYRESLRKAVDYQPKRINIHLMDHDTPPEEAVATWIEMVNLAEELGLKIDLEIHRDTATETPEKSERIDQLFQQLTGKRIIWSLDHSHFATVKHLNPPFAPRLLGSREMTSLVRHIHFRPFNGHHAQIPATDGRSNRTPDFLLYLEFAEALLKHWLDSAPDDAVLHACPENGPRGSGYALSCFPDVWLDAIVVRDEIQKIWSRLIS